MAHHDLPFKVTVTIVPPPLDENFKDVESNDNNELPVGELGLAFSLWQDANEKIITITKKAIQCFTVHIFKT